MSHSPSSGSLSNLPLVKLQELCNDPTSIESASPKVWFEKARYEAEKATMAERFNKPEELFVAYLKAVQYYTRVKSHTEFNEYRKKDAAWGARVKDFKETYEAFLGKARVLKDKLRERDIEKNPADQPKKDHLNGHTRPTTSRQSSGPDAGSLGSIADRMRMLQAKGVDTGPNKRHSRGDLHDAPSVAPKPKGEDLDARLAALRGLTVGAGNFGPSRIVNEQSRSRSNSNSSHIQADNHKQTASSPTTLSPKIPSPPSVPPDPVDHQATGSSGYHSANSHPTEFPSKPPTSPRPLPKPPQDLEDKPIEPPRPSPPNKTVSADNVHEFEKAFPSLSEFSKQYEEPPSDFGFERDPDTAGPSSQANGHANSTPQLDLPDVSGLPGLPNLPSVPSSRPGATQKPAEDGLGPSSVTNADLIRPASTPNVATLSSSPVESDRPLAKSPLGPRSRNSTILSPPAMTFPVAKPTPTTDKVDKIKPKFPLTNSIDPETLRSYFLNPDVDVLLLDVRTEEEFQRGYVGVEYEARAKIELVWLDPNVLMREGMNSTKLEDALSLSPEAQSKAFQRRNKYDIVVVYDSHSLNWPRKESKDNLPPLAKLWEIIYEYEYDKRLERTPVLLTGGYSAWEDFIRGRAAHHAQAWRQAQANGYAKAHQTQIPNGHAPPPYALYRDDADISDRASSSDSKKANRDTPVYQSSPYAKNFTDNMGYSPQSMTGESSYTGRRSYATSPPPLPSSRTHHTPSASLSSYTSPIAAPPQASIHPGPGARRRSDYVDQHNQSYSGYQAPSSRPSIDYPQAHALAPHVPVPAPPPAAQGHTSERFDQRSMVVRSGSMRGLDQMASGGDEVRYWNDVVLGLTGLKNLGNTCYMNSTIQCLSATYPFTSYFLDGSFKRSINVHNPLGMKGKLAMAFAELLKALWKEDYTFLSPVTFRKHIIGFAQQFSGTDQHDSQEFLSFVLDGLHEDLNRIQNKPPPVEMTPEREAALETLPPEVASEREWQIYRMRNDSFIVDLFQGQYRNRLECLTCHKTSTTYDTFMYLSLPVPAGKTKVVVQELIDEFVKPELLDKEDAWNCPKCKVPRRAAKTLTISRLPPVLLIQLKRFTTQNGVFWDKSETPVIFPVKGLDLTRYVPARQITGREDLDDPRTQVGPFRYDLYGVSNHMGTLSSGHYTAYVKSSKGWQYCEDSRVTKANEKDVVSRPAYILFYKRIRV